MRISKSWLLIGLTALVFSSCEKRESQSTIGIVSKSNLIKWGKAFGIREAKENEKLATNDLKPSNVSPELALTKSLQALNSYDDEFSYPLNTVFTVPRVNDVIVNGKYYYAGLLEFDNNKPNGASIKALKGIAPAVVIADARNERKPAQVRTKNAKGEPYKIKVHFESHNNSTYDDNHIFRVVDNAGFENIATMGKEVTTPRLEFDDDWNVYYTLSHLHNDGQGSYGDYWHPKSFLIVNAQTAEVTAYAVDNPWTDADEGENPSHSKLKKFSEIPEWVDWVYSRYLFIQGVTYNGINTENYGKRSVMGDLILDGSQLTEDFYPQNFESVITDISQSRDNKDLIMTGYRTSRSNDMSINSLVTLNLRTGECVNHELRTKNGMTTKSFVTEQILLAGLVKGGYKVQDLTLHNIFGRLTWQGIIVRNAYDNEQKSATSSGNNELIYSDPSFDYVTYIGTVWVEADNDISQADIIWDKDYEVSMQKYKSYLYKQSSRRGLSTILEDKTISGKVTSITSFNKQFIVRIGNSDLRFIVDVDSPYDKETGDVIGLEKGETVQITYGDQKNEKLAPVRILRVIK